MSMDRWPYDGEPPKGWLPYNSEKDYCGPEKSEISKYLRPHIMGVDCNKAYWAHDMRYMLGETEEDKEHADSQMWIDQKLAVCDHYSWWSLKRYLALVIAWRRYHAVCLFGHGAFYSK